MVVKCRESVAAIITYGAGTASGNSSTTVDSMSRKASSSTGETGLASPSSTTSMCTRLSPITLRRWATTSATVSPTITRTLMPARADEAITLRAGEPDSVVVANVVRVMAADSGPAATSARVRTGRRRSALPISGLSGSGACPDSLRNSSTVVSGTDAGIGLRSTLRMARASRAVGPFLAGVDACPPRPSTRSTTLVVPFSVTPIAPTGGLIPGNASPAIAPPSSITNHGSTPRRVSSATASRAAVPLTSSSQPKLSHTSWAGTTPRSSSRSTASLIATRQPLSSRVPRPQTAPSSISAEKGGCCHGAVSSTGTTSRCAIRTTGRAADVPAQRKRRPWVPTRVSSRAAYSRGNSRSCSARKASNAAVSTLAGLRSETVGMRTRACSLATTSSGAGSTVTASD